VNAMVMATVRHVAPLDAPLALRAFLDLDLSVLASRPSGAMARRCKRGRP
jgi:hypothetical protein